MEPVTNTPLIVTRETSRADVVALAEAIDGVRDLIQGEYTPIQIRAQIDKVQAALEAFPQNEAFLRDYQNRLLKHHFANGIYGREAHLEQGTIGVTGIHEEPNISVMVKGKLAIITEDEGCKILEGPKVFVTKPWTRRLIFVMEDTVFCTMHPNPENETNPSVLVARITAKDFSGQFDAVSTICGGAE